MLIELQNINKSFDIPSSQIKRVVLDGISLNISAKEAIAIVGPSGSGKSTLLNIMGALDLPSSGIVLFNSNKLSLLNANQLAEFRNKSVGFVFQQHYLLPQLNLIENVLLPVIPIMNKEERIQSKLFAIELLEKVGLQDKSLQLPYQLSVGECQRAALVRALINKPEVLLADEPTGSLDADSAEMIGNLLLKMREEYSIALVVVTHSSDLANKMDICYKIVNGKVLKN